MSNGETILLDLEAQMQDIGLSLMAKSSTRFTGRLSTLA